MKKFLMFILAAVSIASIACTGKAKYETKVIAHRGFWNTEGSAKNSISSLKNAIELGCFGTEFDVWVTSDGIPVVFHDAKTATGVEIQETTYDSLMLGAEKLANGEVIPTLDEYLATWNHAPVKLVLELKSHIDARRDAWAVGKVLERVNAFGIVPAEIEYIAFSRHAVKAFAEQTGGSSPISYLNGDLSPADAKEQLGATGIDYNKNVLRKNPEWVNEAKGMGMLTNVWTVDDEADMQHFLDAGVDYITTDRPDVLMQMIAQAKK